MSESKAISTNIVTITPTLNAISPPETKVISSKEVVLKAIPKGVHIEASSGGAAIEQTDGNDDALLVEAPFILNKIDNTLPQIEPTLEEKEVDQIAPLGNPEESIVCIDSVSSSLHGAAIEQTDGNDDALLVEAPFILNKIDNMLPQIEPTLEEKEVDQVAPLVNREESIVFIDSVSSSLSGDSFDRLDDHPAKEDEDRVFQEVKSDTEGINKVLGELNESCAEELLKATEIPASNSEEKGERSDEIEIKGIETKGEENMNVETKAEETIKKPVEVPKDDIAEKGSNETYKHKIFIGLLMVAALTFLWKKVEK